MPHFACVARRASPLPDTLVLTGSPFVIGSGPPGTNYNTMAKAFKSGWGGVVAKTVSLTDNPVNNVAPRYGQHRFATQTTSLSTSK